MSGRNRGPKPQRVLDLAKMARIIQAARPYCRKDPRTVVLGTAYEEAIKELASLQPPEFGGKLPRFVVPGCKTRIRFDISWVILDNIALVYGSGSNKVYMQVDTEQFIMLEHAS